MDIMVTKRGCASDKLFIPIMTVLIIIGLKTKIMAGWPVLAFCVKHYCLV